MDKFMCRACGYSTTYVKFVIGEPFCLACHERVQAFVEHLKREGRAELIGVAAGTVVLLTGVL